ncbi:hypothetical protein HYS11_00745 [Candidatus Gottesmanbacteria bacterium]|nr:hypothetical protein [Candidatus Gottesmanbacteria bacterium]
MEEEQSLATVVGKIDAFSAAKPEQSYPFLTDESTLQGIKIIRPLKTIGKPSDDALFN